MTGYLIVIQDQNSPQGSPPWVFVDLEGATWRISAQNSWVGVGSGEFKVVGVDYRTLELRDGDFYSGTTRIKLSGIKYPDDCKPRGGGPFAKGPGIYRGVNDGFIRNLTWTGRNIMPEP